MELDFIKSLNKDIDLGWNEIKAKKFWRLILNKNVSKELYRDLMIEIHHYTKHNSMNQAISAFVDAPEGLLRFAYVHAAEELGHERMVIRDLESIELLNKTDLSRRPLPATDALIGYLYFVALKLGPVARLGYSFWAENVYGHFNAIIEKIKHDLSLEDKNLTFFVAHAKIDQKHSAQVEDCIKKYALTTSEQELVRQVAVTTLFLTGQMLEQVAERHL